MVGLVSPSSKQSHGNGKPLSKDLIYIDWFLIRRGGCFHCYVWLPEGTYTNLVSSFNHVIVFEHIGFTEPLNLLINQNMFPHQELPFGEYIQYILYLISDTTHVPYALILLAWVRSRPPILSVMSYSPWDPKSLMCPRQRARTKQWTQLIARQLHYIP